MTTTVDELNVLRAQIDALDDSIINLLQERFAVSKRIQRGKADVGLPQTDIARELEVIWHYREAFGWRGHRLATSILVCSKEDD